jgi:ribonuclease III
MSVLFPFFRKKDNEFNAQLYHLLGYKPRRVSLYKMALTHSSLAEKVEGNNERLEFLGDAVLSSVVGHYLFTKYPYKGEGFLTEMRSKMVNRMMLNEIGKKLGLDKIALYNKNDNSLKKSQIFGNALEALLGAVFLEKGYKKTNAWIISKIIIPFLDVDELENIEINFKNKLLSWANKQGKSLKFEMVEENVEKGRKYFIMAVMLEGEIVAKGRAFNKKDASQLAAQEAIVKYEL